MTARSRHIPMVEKAACLAGALFAIPYEHRKEITASQLLSLVEFHHDVIPFAEGGPSSHWNLTAMLRAEHKHVTRAVTIPAIAKGKRLMRANEEFQRKVLPKPCGHKRQRTAKIPARVNPWPKKGARKVGRGR